MSLQDGKEIGTERFSRTMRRAEDERLALVADAKRRMIGIDKGALDRQVQEKQAAALKEKERDLYYDNLSDMFSKKLSVLEQERHALKVELERQQVEFQQMQQRKEQRREFDLSDPKGLQKSLPARIGDDDPLCGPASLQKFAGEDLEAAARKQRQLAQQAAWCAEQVRQKEAALDKAKAEEAAFAAQAARSAAHATFIDAKTRAARAAFAAAVAQANDDLAAARRAREAADKAATDAANLAEIEYTTTDPFHTEDPNTAVSALAPWRVRKDHFKGFSQAQKEDILATQAAQLEDRSRRQAADRDAELQFAAQQEAIRKALEVKAMQVDQFKRDQAAQAAAFLQQQKQMKTTRDMEMHKLYTTNVPTDGFFSRFGTSAR